MDVKNARCAWMMTCALVTTGVSAIAGSAVAQEAELPPIVVEGATLEAKPLPKPKRTTETPADAAEADEPAVAAPPADGADGEAVSAEAVAGEGAGGATGIDARKIGSAVSVVTGDQLRVQKIPYVADALRSLPGVSVSRTGGLALKTQVRIRGAEANQTLVIIDGVEANDTMNGEFDFSELSTEDIERIEVLRGGFSGLYGSGAAGGVINIVTRGGRGPLTIAAFGEGGSFNTRAGGVRASAGSDKVWGSISLSGREADGFNIAPQGDEDDGAKLTTFNMRAGVEVMPGLVLDGSLRQVHENGDRDIQEPFPSVSGVQFDSPAVFNEETFLGSLRLRWDSADGIWTQTARVTRNEAERSDDDKAGFFTGNEGTRLTYIYDVTGRFNTGSSLRHILTGFIDHEEETFISSSFSTDPFFPFPADNTENERSRQGYAFEYRGEYFDRLFLTGVVRHDNNDSFEDFTTWRTSLSVDLSQFGLRPHASTGTSVKFPTMFEQFGSIPGFFTPNPNLLPEESFGWDAGVEFTIIPNRATVDVTYFKADLENQIQGFFFPVNLPGISHRQGVEVGGRFAVTPGLTLGASYTYLDATDPDGSRSIRRPEHSGRLDVDYTFDDGRARINAAAMYNGEMLDTNFGPFPSVDVTLDDYLLLNVAASYRISPGVELYGRVENLLNEDYQEVYGFETADIAAYAGLRFTYVEEATRAWAEGR
jgi:vitamin B12 transporter